MRNLFAKLMLLAAVIMPLTTWSQTYQSVPYSTGFEGLATAKKVIKASIERYLEAHPDLKFQKDATKFAEDITNKVKKALEG